MIRSTLRSIILIGFLVGALHVSFGSLKNNVKAMQLMQPAIPSRFYGTVMVDGQNVPTDTVLSILIGSNVLTSTVITYMLGTSSYMIDIPGDNPATPIVEGGVEGDEIIFKIPMFTATQRGVWRFGEITELNLTLLPDPVSIPEPITIILFGTGLSILAGSGLLNKQKRR